MKDSHGRKEEYQYEIDEIKLRPGEGLEKIPERILKKLRADASRWCVSGWRVLRRSVDARDRTRIAFVHRVAFSLAPVGREDGSASHAVGAGGARGAGEGCGKSDAVGAGKARGAREGLGKGAAAGKDCAADTDALVARAAKRSVRVARAHDLHQADGQTEGDGLFAGSIPVPVNASPRMRPVVVGFGPCGIFAAYALAQAGLCPIVLERGRAVDERARDVARFWTHGALDGESNVLFGEGGAGTFSDGKLTTGIGDSRKRFVLERLVAAGGGEDLLVDARPHIGTDVLRVVVKNLREEIIALGGEIRFSTKLSGVELDAGGALRAVRAVMMNRTNQSVSEKGVRVPGAAAGSKAGMEAPIAMETTIDTDTLILAIGHSARDSYECLLSAGLHLRQKPFSIGLRIEHRQTSIDAGQYGVDFEKTYGMDVRAAGLPPAEYKLSWRGEDGRGVYSFCMCPGGEVIACASEQGGIFSNGMSYGARSGAFANSAILVDVRTEDFASTSPLAGLDFRRIYERQAFALSAQVRAASAQPAGGSPSPVPSTASAASVPCALPAFPCAASARPTGDAPHMSAAPSHKARLLPSERVAGFLGADSLLASCLPEFAVRGIRTALPRFGRKLQGFDAPDAWLYGPETRSSSPVRIPRDEDGMANIPGVFPAGEGAGYAGGIMSAAVDGLRAAQAVIARSCASRGSSSL